MLSYQHQYHAGNHADVFKHLCLIALVNKLQQKSKPFFFADSHAGAGEYPLNANDGLHCDEVFARLLNFSIPISNSSKSRDLSLQSEQIIKDYKTLLENYSTQLDVNAIYPGSSVILSDLCRTGDAIHCNELHHEASNALKKRMRNTDVHVHKCDAFEFINANIPPKAPNPKRGAILIDPPYEDSYEYDKVVKTVKNALHKWPMGIIAIWYPLLSECRKDRKSGALVKNPKSGLSEKMLQQLSSLQANGLIDCRFVCQSKNHFYGMYGSGVAIINPPWQLDLVLGNVLSFLEAQLDEKNRGYSGVTTLLNSA